jgi:signal peptidase I
LQHLDTNRRKDARQIDGERREGDAQLISEALVKHGRIALRVHGTSMLPWVRPGDVALIRHTDNSGVRLGDVALYRRENHIYVHRIVSKSGSWHSAKLTAKGDAHPKPDGVLEQGELLGRVVRLYRDGSRIDLESTTHLALGLLIAKLSRNSHFWYPVARVASFLGRPIRRVLSAFRAPREVPQ